MTYKGFNAEAFIEYIGSRHGLYVQPDSYLENLLQNIIRHAHEHCHVSKDQFVYFICEIIPDVEFGEVAMFMGDECLTDEGMKMKYRWITSVCERC